MITRNVIGDNFPALVDYLHYGRPDAPGNKQALILFAEGVRTDSSQAMGADFAWGSTLNTSLKKPVWHTAISFNPDDAAKLTNEKMLAVAQDFRTELGLLNTQCVIMRHFDRDDNQHLHILVNRVANDGHSIRDNRNYHRSKEAVELLCERHGLTPWAGQRPDLQHPERIVGAYDKAGAEIRQALAYGLQTATERATLWEELKGKGITTNESSRGVSFTKDGFTFKGSQVARQYSLGGIDQQLAANQLVQVQQAEAQAAEARENEQLRRRGQQVLTELVDQKAFANRAELTGQVGAEGYAFVSSLDREMKLRHAASGREFALVAVQPGGPAAPSFWDQADAVIHARAAEAAAHAERRELARQETTQVLTQTRDAGLRQPGEFFDRLRAQPFDVLQDAQTKEITHVIHRQRGETFAWAEVQPGGAGAPPLAEQLATAVQAEAQRVANQRREEDRVQVERVTTRVCDERNFYTPAELHAGLQARGVTWLPPVAPGQAHQFRLKATGQRFPERDVLRGHSMTELLAGAEERRLIRRRVLETHAKHDLQEILHAPQTPLTGVPDYQRQLEARGYQLLNANVPGRALEIEHQASGERFDVARLQPGGPTAAPLLDQVAGVVAQQKLAREIPQQATQAVEQVLAARNFTSRPAFNNELEASGYRFVTGMDGSERLLHEASKYHFPLAQVRPHGRELGPQVNAVIAARQAERLGGPPEVLPASGAQPAAPAGARTAAPLAEAERRAAIFRGAVAGEGEALEQAKEVVRQVLTNALATTETDGARLQAAIEKQGFTFDSTGTRIQHTESRLAWKLTEVQPGGAAAPSFLAQGNAVLDANRAAERERDRQLSVGVLAEFLRVKPYYLEREELTGQLAKVGLAASWPGEVAGKGGQLTLTHVASGQRFSHEELPVHGKPLVSQLQELGNAHWNGQEREARIHYRDEAQGVKMKAALAELGVGVVPAAPGGERVFTAQYRLDSAKIEDIDFTFKKIKASDGTRVEESSAATQQRADKSLESFMKSEEQNKPKQITR